MPAAGRGRRTTAGRNGPTGGPWAVSWPEVRGEVDRGENEHPHHVHEMPVHRDDLSREIVGGIEPTAARVVLDPQVHEESDEDVERVEPGDREEQCPVHVRGRSEF